jgi:hypothetical protein
VLTRTTGISAFDFARERLFAPLGITHAAWSTDADGVSHGWGDLQLQPRDMAKLGYLWLHNGRWDGRQVIPADYLAQALTSHISVQPGIAYGYGMWLYPGHSPVDFEANGTGGQRITVIPSLDMVEVMTGGGSDANQVAQMIATAPKSAAALPANPEAATRLAAIAGEVSPRMGVTSGAETVPSVAVPQPKPRPTPDALLAEAVAPAGSLAENMRAIPIPRARPDAPLGAAIAQTIPIPQPKPDRMGSMIAEAARPANKLPIPRPKPDAKVAFNTTVAGLVSAPGTARTAENLRTSP